MKNQKMVGFFAVFFEILPNFSDFVNSDDCIGKITSKSARLQLFFIKKKFEVIKKKKISSEKMINSGNFIHDYAHSIFGENL